MLRHFFWILMVLIFRFSFAQELSATQKVPKTVMQGTDYNSEITIIKGSMNGYIKFSQRAPNGFSISEIDSKGGSFKFKDSVVTIVWVIPPTENEFTISFKVSVPKDAIGVKKVKGKITYFFNIQHRFFYLEPQTITVIKDSIVHPEILKLAGNVDKVPEVIHSNVSDSASKTIASPIAVGQKVIDSLSAKTIVVITADTTKNIKVLETSTSIKSPSKDSISGKTNTENSPAKIENITQTKVTASETETKQNIPAKVNSAIVEKTYRVQIGVFKSKPKLVGISEISKVVLENGTTKYFTGNFVSLEDAAKRKIEMFGKGYNGSFIVSFEDGKIVK